MLRQHCDAADAAVIVEDLDETSKRLIAYVVRGPNAAWKLDVRSGASRDLRNLLERYLPLYSVPSHFIELDALPINQQTGKLQRKALPSLRNGASLGQATNTTHGNSRQTSGARLCVNSGPTHWNSTSTIWRTTGTSLISAATPWLACRSPSPLRKHLESN